MVQPNMIKIINSQYGNIKSKMISLKRQLNPLTELRLAVTIVLYTYRGLAS